MTTILNLNLESYQGSIAGREEETSIRGGRTYSRVLDEQASSVNELRTRIAPPWDRAASLVANESGRPWGWITTRLQGVGYFKILETSNDNRQSGLSGHKYALERIGKPLEEISGLPNKKIQHQCGSYGIQYFVNRFFNGVQKPEEGDLVVYYSTDKPIHAGIFHTSEANSPAGTVESKWGNGALPNPFVFQHDIFFLPAHCGNVVKFYRLKNEAEPSKVLPKHDESSPMYTRSEDKKFRYISNEANNKIRRTLTFECPDEPTLIMAKLPQIECLDDIDFSGVCLKYAFDKIFGSDFYILTKDILDNYAIFGTIEPELIQKLFTPSEHPQVGDLAIYTDSSNRYSVHFGVYVADDLIESKWGNYPVYRHPPFYVYNSYGDTITYYRLNAQ